MSPHFPTGGPGGAAPAEATVLLRTFSTRTQADLAVSCLEARGFPCWTAADDAGGMLPNLTTPGGVKLFVRQADAEAAYALLTAPAVEPEPGFSPASPPPPDDTNSLGAFMLGILVGVLCCVVFGYATSTKRGTRTYREDSNGDGVIDVVRVYQSGYLTQVLRDRNFDGKWDYWADFDAAGHPVSAREDNNFDGRPDTFLTYTNGQLLTLQRDTDFNGIPDVTYAYKFGIVQRADWQPNGSANITRRDFYTNGVLSKTLRDTRGSGSFDEVVKFDAFENPVETNVVNLPATP
jgi:hypothetical protein